MNIGDFSKVMLGFATINSNGAPDFKNGVVLGHWFNQLKDIDPDRLTAAMRSLVNGKFFPCIDDIKACCGDSALSDEERARELIGKIRTAVGKFGWQQEQAVMEYLGPAGQFIVRAMGGWGNVCGYQTDEALNIALAQQREYAKVMCKQERNGEINEGFLPPAQKLHLLVSELAEKIARK